MIYALTRGQLLKKPSQPAKCAENGQNNNYFWKFWTQNGEQKEMYKASYIEGIRIW